jgi:ubiquinone/menaquinone biosynthesis C-methylase UbiE
LAIKPLANLAKHRARNMMIQRAESIGVYWRQEVQKLRSRNSSESFAPEWEQELKQIQNPNLNYPAYYVCSFHAYEEGNLGWEPAMEVEVAAKAVHARIWQEAGAEGDTWLRKSYHDILQAQITQPPQDILDIGCSVGMSTFALQAIYPEANLTGVDLSPYFLAIAQYHSGDRGSGVRDQGSEIRDQGRWGDGEMITANSQQPIANSQQPIANSQQPIANSQQPIANSQQLIAQTQNSITWLHAAAEATGLPNASFDLVSAHLLFHELPTEAAIAILREARRVLRPGGHLAIMDMNPNSEIYAKMPPYILTLLKSTEPYLDEYFALDLEQAMYEAGFTRPTVTCNSPRHRTAIAQVR